MCPTKQASAQEIEDFVVSRVRAMGQDKGLVAEVARQTVKARASRAPELEAEHRRLARELDRLDREARWLLDALGEGKPSNIIGGRLAEAEELARKAERRLTEVREELIAIERETVDERDLASALAHFDPVWDALFPREQARILKLLIERIDWDREGESLRIAFRPAGIKTLALEAGGKEAGG